MYNPTIQSNPTLRFTPSKAPHRPNFEPTAAARPTHDAIAELAYDLYVATGRSEGRTEQNWLQAEHDLTSRATAVFEAKQFMDSQAFSGQGSGGPRR